MGLFRSIEGQHPNDWPGLTIGHLGIPIAFVLYPIMLSFKLQGFGLNLWAT